MLGTRVPHLGHTSTGAHPLICFRPGGQGSLRLFPMDNGSLVTPVQKPRHSCAMRACRHEAPHTLLIFPSGHRPEGPASVRQQAATLKPGRRLDLAHGAVSIAHEEGQEANRSNSQARDTDKGHTTLTPGSSLLHPGHWFPLVVVLPFVVSAVGSAALLSRLVGKWPAYPKPLMGGRGDQHHNAPNGGAGPDPAQQEAEAR